MHEVKSTIFSLGATEIAAPTETAVQLRIHLLLNSAGNLRETFIVTESGRILIVRYFAARIRIVQNDIDGAAARMVACSASPRIFSRKRDDGISPGNTACRFFKDIRQAAVDTGYKTWPVSEIFSHCSLKVSPLFALRDHRLYPTLMQTETIRHENTDTFHRFHDHACHGR